MTADTLKQLQQQIDITRSRFFAAWRDLEVALAPLRPKPYVPEQLISKAEEFGTDFAVAYFRREPEAFGLATAPLAQRPGFLNATTPTVRRLVEASASLDQLTTKREHLLCAQNPSHQRVYNFYGREAVLDMASKTLRYTDASESEPVTVTTVEPTARPPTTRSRNTGLVRRRNRRRDNDRE